MADSRPLVPSAGDPLEELVFLYLEEREQGLAAGLEEFERRHPEAARSEVRERIRALEAAGLLVSAGADEPFPERLGDFRLIERLGGGGMGVVFRAEQSSLGREVALKLIRPEQLYFPRAKERFRREVEAVARLSHPGIVPVFACGEERGVPYYAMELVDGVSLAEALRLLAARPPAALSGRDLAAAFGGRASGALFERSWPEACLEIARQVALALDHAHSRGVVHRDVKPSNIMLTPEGSARLLDFGLASQSGAARLTGTGAQLGSTAYMSPELSSGRVAEADARTDVYSLGVSLYESLTLRLPFTGASTTELVGRILDGSVVAPRRLNAALSADAEVVCLTAMATETGRRYASARALADDLANVLARRPIAARRASALSKAGHWARRHPARATSAALATLLVFGGPLAYGVLQARAAARQRELNVELVAANREVARREERLAAANRELEQRGAELERALARETAEHERAQRGFERAQRSVDEMLAEVGAETLADVPQMEPVRRKLLEKALAFYQELLDEAPQDAAVRRERARTERSIGDLLNDLGRFDEARARFEAALALLRELEAEDPSVETRQALAGTLGQLANQHSARGDAPGAERLWREAIELVERDDPVASGTPRAGIDLVLLRNSLAYGLFARGDTAGSLEQYLRAAEEGRELRARDPADVDIGYALVSSLSAAAQVLGHLTRPAESDRAYAESYMLLEELLQQAPDSARLRAQMVELANNYGVRLLAGADAERTGRVLERGFESARTLARDFPADPDKRKSLAVIGLNLAVHHANSGRFEDAAPVMATSVAALESLYAEFPELVEYPYFLGAALSNAAGVAEKLGRLEQAEAQSARAVELLRKALEATGGHSGVKANLSSALFQRAGVRRAHGDLARALELAEESLALEPRRADVLYEGVEVLGALALAARDSGDSEREQRSTALAVDVLSRAIDAGFQDAARLRSAADLELVRAHARFAELAARIPSAGQ